MDSEEFLAELVKVDDWLVDGSIQAEVNLATPAMLQWLGDDLFLKHDNQGVVKKSWADEGLFRRLYGGKIKVETFGDVGLCDWYQQPPHRRAIAKAGRLRASWVGRWNRVADCQFVTAGTSRWDRKLNQQLLAQLQAKLTEAKAKVRWSALGGSLPYGLTQEQLTEKVNETMAEIEAAYRDVYFRGMTAYLRRMGSSTKQGIDAARHGLERALCRRWKWAEPRHGENDPSGFAAGAVRLDAAGEPTHAGVAVLSCRQMGQLANQLGGVEHAKDFLHKMEELFRSIALAKTGAGNAPAPWVLETVRRMGLSLEDGLSGRLVRDWKSMVAQALLAQIGRSNGDLLEITRLAGIAGEKIIEETGLVSSTAVRWEGEVVVMPLVEQAARVSACHLFNDSFERAGLSPAEINSPCLGLLDAADSRRTVYREAVADRLPPEARRWWDELESQRESVFVTMATGDLRLRALHDGIARSYLGLVGMIPGSATESPFGVGKKFWNEVQSGCGPHHLWVLADAAMAAQVWAFSQLLGGGESWLGLSPSYMRFLRRAFSLLLPLVGFFRDGTWLYKGDNLLAKTKMTEAMQVQLLSSLSAQPDPLLIPMVREDFVEIAGIKVGKDQVHPLMTSKPIKDYLHRGYFRSDGFRHWEYNPQRIGAAIPGLTYELQTRSYAHLIDLFCWGNNGHGQALLCESLSVANGGKFPSALLPLPPVGFNTWKSYAKSYRDCGNRSISHLVWRLPAHRNETDHLTTLATFDQPMWNEPESVKGFASVTALFAQKPGAVLKQWESIVERPSLAGFNMANLSAVLYMARVLTNLAKGVHPITLVPFSEGGGCPAGAEPWVRQVWQPMFASGHCLAGSSAVELAPSLRPLQRLVRKGLGL